MGHPAHDDGLYVRPRRAGLRGYWADSHISGGKSSLLLSRLVICAIRGSMVNLRHLTTGGTHTVVTAGRGSLSSVTIFSRSLGRSLTESVSMLYVHAVTQLHPAIAWWCVNKQLNIGNRVDNAACC